MLKIIGLVCTALWFVSVFAAKPPMQFDPPDLNFEFQLHRQYLANRGMPVEQAQAPKGIIESYQLQTGENLWNLSQMLYGDGNFWPKVWAQNKSITNPHLIRPGHTLHFQMGSEDDTPSFRFSEAEEPGLELAAARGEGPQIDIPPPETPPRPIAKVPDSFPEWQALSRKRGHFQVDWSKMNGARPMPPDRLPLSAYVQDNPIEEVGTFLELERESGLPVTNQYVYVKIKKGMGQKGSKFVIVKDMGQIRKLNSQVEGKITARFIQVFGDLELTDSAPASFRKSKDRENYEVFRAVLLNVTHLTLSDYQLIPGTLEHVDLSRNGPEGTANAQIIGSNKHDSSALYGSGDIVFLNKGSKDGVEPGQILDIYIDRTIRDEKTPVSFSSVSSGQVKIVKSSGMVSTGVILRAIDSIQQGDRAQPRVSTNVAEPELPLPPVPTFLFTVPQKHRHQDRSE